MSSALARLTLCAALALAGCSDTIDRTLLLNSSGPQLDAEQITKFESSFTLLRRFNFSNPEQKPISAQNLPATRDAALAYVDQRCDAYLDAIFWAGRSRTGMLGAAASGGAATSAILAATASPAVAIAATAAGFGLATGLINSYYDSYLYAYDASRILDLMQRSRATLRASFGAPASEADALTQVQAYIRNCSPPNIERMVNDAISQARMAPVRAGLSAAQTERLGELMDQAGDRTLTPAGAAELQALVAQAAPTLGLEETQGEPPGQGSGAGAAEARTAGTPPNPASGAATPYYGVQIEP